MHGLKLGIYSHVRADVRCVEYVEHVKRCKVCIIIICQIWSSSNRWSDSWWVEPARSPTPNLLIWPGLGLHVYWFLNSSLRYEQYTCTVHLLRSFRLFAICGWGMPARVRYVCRYSFCTMFSYYIYVLTTFSRTHELLKLTLLHVCNVTDKHQWIPKDADIL